MESSCRSCSGAPGARAGVGALLLGSGLLAVLLPKCPWCLLAYASLLGVALDLPLDLPMAITTLALLCAAGALVAPLFLRRGQRS